MYKTIRMGQRLYGKYLSFSIKSLVSTNFNADTKVYQAIDILDSEKPFNAHKSS